MDRLKSRAGVSLAFSSLRLTAFNLKFKLYEAFLFGIAINEHARQISELEIIHGSVQVGWEGGLVLRQGS